MERGSGGDRLHILCRADIERVLESMSRDSRAYLSRLDGSKAQFALGKGRPSENGVGTSGRKSIPLSSVRADSAAVLYESAEPSALTIEQRDQALALIAFGGEVALITLKTLFENSRCILMASSEGKIVGVAAVKVPNRTYAVRVFHKAESQDLDRYPYELGWVYVVPEKRRLGIADRLCELALSDQPAVGAGVYATTREDNTGMMRILQEHGFVKLGRSYEGRNGMICLFGRLP
jgi:ribosomal protein S18 acetylase RimI-like enzyme